MKKILSLVLSLVSAFTLTPHTLAANPATITENPPAIVDGSLPENRLYGDENYSREEGRTNKYGKIEDDSDWIRIGKNGDYSLIVRVKPIDSRMYIYWNEEEEYFGEKIINEWYANYLGLTLKGFTVMNNAPQELTGFSIPTGENSRYIGRRNVAFSLSKEETALLRGSEIGERNLNVLMNASEDSWGRSYDEYTPSCYGIFTRSCSKNMQQENHFFDEEERDEYYFARQNSREETLVCSFSYFSGKLFFESPQEYPENPAAMCHMSRNTFHPALWVRSEIFE